MSMTQQIIDLFQHFQHLYANKYKNRHFLEKEDSNLSKRIKFRRGNTKNVYLHTHLIMIVDTVNM